MLFNTNFNTNPYQTINYDIQMFSLNNLLLQIVFQFKCIALEKKFKNPNFEAKSAVWLSSLVGMQKCTNWKLTDYKDKLNMLLHQL